MPFYKTQIIVTVLSETPIEPGTDLADIAHGIDDGADVGTVVFQPSEEITSKDMAAELIAAGSTPDFFGLDADGNRAED